MWGLLTQSYFCKKKFFPTSDTNVVILWAFTCPYSCLGCDWKLPLRPAGLDAWLSTLSLSLSRTGLASFALQHQLPNMCLALVTRSSLPSVLIGQTVCHMTIFSHSHRWPLTQVKFDNSGESNDHHSKYIYSTMWLENDFALLRELIGRTKKALSVYLCRSILDQMNYSRSK